MYLVKSEMHIDGVYI